MLPFTYDKSVFNIDCGNATDLEFFREICSVVLLLFALDISENEGCEWTLPELHSYLIDGVTVGGHTIKDEDIVRNVKKCWENIQPEDIYSWDSYDYFVTINSVCSLHSSLMKGILVEKILGNFRSGDVTISGTSKWRCLNALELRNTFLSESEEIKQIPNVLEKAIITQLWLSYRQFFEDGNKRVARMATNSILFHKMTGVFAVPARGHARFTKLLCEFYDTSDATELCKFIVDYCLYTFDKQGSLVRPKPYVPEDEIHKSSLKFMNLDIGG